MISIFHPSSPEAQSLYDLTFWIIILCGVILALVVSLVTFACIRFSGHKNSPEPKPVHGNIWLESFWTGGLLLTLTVVMFFTIRTMTLASPSGEVSKPDLIVIGHQWWWEIRYPMPDGTDVVTANEIHIRIGKKLLLELRSADVIHDFWVPDLGRKIDAIPGHPNQIWLEASHEGLYLGFCAEFCGASHAWMKIRVIAEDEKTFSRWVAHMRTPAIPPDSAITKQGLDLFRQKTCVNCHHINGESDPVQIGPDLTHIGSRETLAAGALKNTPFDLSRWLENPGRIKPGANMPAFGLSKAEIQSLTSYLESLQ